MISCIILSAGESARFGSPKALALIDQNNALETIQNKVLQTSVDEIIIVLGHAHERIEPYVFNHKKVRVVYNKDYKFGQTSSVQTALLAVDARSNAFILIPVDCPFISPSTIDELIQNYDQKIDILIPMFKGKRGHPPLLKASLKKRILDLSPEQGLNVLFEQHNIRTIEINDPGIIRSFNTQEELDAINKKGRLK